MSITRRRFLLRFAGASAGFIVPAFYARALDFLTRFDQPLIEPATSATKVLYTGPQWGWNFFLGHPDTDPPSQTWREFILAEEGKVPNDPDYLEDFYEITPDMLDEQADDEYVSAKWHNWESPRAQAHLLLDGLDIGPELRHDGIIGGLEFEESEGMGSCYRAVRAEDAISVSLLQERLNQLNSGVRIELLHD